MFVSCFQSFHASEIPYVQRKEYTHNFAFLVGSGGGYSWTNIFKNFFTCSRNDVQALRKYCCELLMALTSVNWTVDQADFFFFVVFFSTKPKLLLVVTRLPLLTIVQIQKCPYLIFARMYYFSYSLK